MASLKNTLIDDTGYLQLPSGTTAQRPSSPSAGYMRWNTTDSVVEVYNGSEWIEWPFDSLDIVTDSLLFFYDASNTTSYPGTGTSLLDLSGNGLTATLTNGASYASSDGGSILLDGTDDSINLSLDLRRDWSFECWVNHDTVSGFSFLGQGPTSTNQGLHIWNYNGSAIRFGMYSNDRDFTLSTSTGVWYQYVFTYTHSSPYTKKMYRNGVEITTGTNVGGPNQYSGTGTLRIGAIYSSHNGSFADGNFAISRMYGKVLSLSEIQKNFDAHKTTYGIS